MLRASFQLFFLLAFLIPLVLFLLTQQNTLKRIQPFNRTMSPGGVWLQLIPLFGMVWQFIVVSRIAESLQREAVARATAFSFETVNKDNYINLTKPTYEVGLAYCILMCCSFIPLLGVFTTLAGIICWIIYWIKLAQYKNKLQQYTIQ